MQIIAMNYFLNFDSDLMIVCDEIGGLYDPIAFVEFFCVFS